MADRRKLLAEALQRPNVTTGAANPALRPTAASVDRNHRLLEVLSQPIHTPRTQPGAIAPVDASMVAALANIARSGIAGHRQKKTDAESRELLAHELAMAGGEDPFKSELQPIDPLAISERVGILPGPGAEDVVRSLQAGVKPFVEAREATRKQEGKARTEHDLAALLDPRAGVLASQRMSQTGPEWSEPYVDEATGAVLQRNERTGETQEVSRPPSAGDDSAKFNLLHGSGRDSVVVGGKRVYTDTGEPVDIKSDPIRARMTLVQRPDGSVMQTWQDMPYGEGATTPANGSEVVTSGEALEGVTARATAEAEAKAKVESDAKAAEKSAANQDTLNVWNVARAGLMKGLEGAETGPVVGRVPAVTAAQQTAEGAVAAVAPVLKQLFRSAGEGIFTDKDQELLLRMVPQRTDHPEARNAKMEMIDAIIQAKLGGVPATTGQPAPTETPPVTDLPEGVSEADIAFTMEKHRLTREEVLERLNAP